MTLSAMPCSPVDLTIDKYHISAFQDGVAGEVAARVLHLIIERGDGEWIGVSWADVVAQADAEVTDRNARLRARSIHNRQMVAHQRAADWFNRMNRLTDGFYGKLVTLKDPPPTPEKVPMLNTRVYLSGSLILSKGVNSLITSKLLELRRERGDIYLYATPKLIEFILDND